VTSLIEDGLEIFQVLDLSLEILDEFGVLISSHIAIVSALACSNNGVVGGRLGSIRLAGGG
jgi:acid phosphatase family membrane protein YuiD